MSYFKKLPTDPEILALNTAQWLWICENIIEDKTDKEDTWIDRFNYVGMYINPDAAREVAEYQKRERMRKSSQSSNDPFNNLYNKKKQQYSSFVNPADINELSEYSQNVQENMNNTEIPTNTQPSKNIIPQAEYEHKDFVENTEFDALLEQYGFNPNEVVEIPSTDVGDAFMSEDEFLQKAFAFEQFINTQDNVINNDTVNNKSENETLSKLDSSESIKQQEIEIKNLKNKYGINPNDIDIIDIDE